MTRETSRVRPAPFSLPQQTGQVRAFKLGQLALQLRKANLEYVRSRTSFSRPGEHAEHVLQELVEETRLGRVIGPARASDHWPVTTVPLHDVLDMDTRVFAAASFAILQEDEHGHVKIRRGGLA